MRGKSGDARKLESSSKPNQGTLWSAGDFWYTEASKLTEGSAENDTSRRDTHEVQGTGDKILVTISVKQAGFYGSQLSTEVCVHTDSHLLRAMAAERKRGKDPLEWFSNKITREVLSILCLVPGISAEGCTPHTHLADHPDDATEA